MIRSHDIEPLIKFQRFVVGSDVTSDRMRWLTRRRCSMSGDTIKDGFLVRPGVMMQCCLRVGGVAVFYSRRPSSHAA
jgi:hypothetical protein